MLNFINNWTIDLNKLPTYDKFKDEIKLKLDKPFCELLMNGVNDNITNEMITNFKNNVYDHIDEDGCLTIKHNNRFDMGRFYSDNDKSLCCHSKYIKHTLFVLMNWLDIDMVKGHPSILRYLCILNGIEHSIFDKVVYYFDDVCNKIIIHYKNSCDIELDEDSVKFDHLWRGIFHVD